MHRSEVGKLLHLMKWTRPDVLNAVRELSRYMTEATKTHRNAMYRFMHYIVGTSTRGLKLTPNAKWNGDKEFEFEISGQSDSDYAKDSDERKSVSGYCVYLNGASYSSCDVVGYRSRVSKRHAVCTGHVVWNASSGIDRTKGEGTNDTQDGQQGRD